MTTSHLQRTLALATTVLALGVGGAFAATTVTSVSVLAGPGGNFKTVTTLPADDHVTLASKSGSWCDLSAPTKGWVLCSDIDGGTRTVAEAPAKSSGWSGYDYNTDPYLGMGFGALHETNGAQSNQ